MATRERWATGIPRIDASDPQILDYFKAHFNDDARFRRAHMYRMACNLLFYRGRQHVSVPRLDSSAAGYVFVDRIRRRNGDERPVDNRIAPGVDNEVARLGRQVYEPKVRASRPEPDLERAAGTSESVLKSDLLDLGWDRLREARDFDIVTCGIAIGRAWWDETVTETVTVGNPDAVACPDCQTKLASSTISARHVLGGGLRNTHSMQDADDAEDGEPRVGLMHCPMCDSHKPLQKYNVGQEEAESGLVDPFGEPFGLDAPKGSALLEIVSPFEFYPENGGVGLESHQSRIFGRRSVQDLDWIDAHLPPSGDWDPEKVYPEPAADLLRWHPLQGDRSMTGGGRSGLDSISTYQHHAAVEELVVLPQKGVPGLEQGRWIQVCQGKVARNGTLTVPVELEGEDEPVEVARVTYASAIFKRIPGEFWARSPVDDCRPIQKRINRILEQADELRERGMPQVALRDGDEIKFDPNQEGPLNVVMIDSVDGNFNVRDSIFNSTPLTGNVYMEELEGAYQAISQILGPSGFEMGQNPSGVTSGDQLQILAEQKAAERGRRERKCLDMDEAMWRAHLELTWAFRREEAQYQARGDNDQYDREMYTGTDLMHQVNVKCEAGGKFDRSTFLSGAVDWAVENGLIDVQNDPVARTRALQMKGMPDLNEDKSIQVSRAEEAWSKFVRKGQVPVIDPDLDDCWIHFQVLGKRWHSDDGMRIRLSCAWDSILQSISGAWERKLIKAEMQDQAQREVYEGIPPQAWPDVFAQGQAMEQHQKATQQKLMSSAPPGAPPAMLPQMPPIPAPPATGEFLPDSMQDRIEQIMFELAAPVMVTPAPADPTAPPEDDGEEMKRRKTQEQTLAMYATIQACRILDERKKAEAMGGGMVAAAPGGGRTQQGMVPKPGQPMLSQPGTTVSM